MTASVGSEKERVRRVARSILFGEPPQVIADRYEVIEHIGRGGLGDVYRCRDVRLRRELAIKFVRASRQRAAEESELFREAIVLAQLSHPNIVPVFDVGSIGDEVFIAMALVDGVTLQEMIEETPLSWPMAVHVFGQVADALAAAHGAGIVHGDVKPQNLMVDRERQARVLDFGLARELLAPAPIAGDSLSTRPSGTAGYLAPERHRGVLDAATDQFAFGVAMYRALWGQLPAHADPPSAVMLDAAFDRKATQRIPRWLVEIVRRAVAHDPSARFASMAELRDALTRGPGRAGWFVGGALAIAGVLLTSWLGITSDQCHDPELDEPWSQSVRAEITGRIPEAQSVEIAAALESYAVARTDLRRSSCEALVTNSITPLLHDLRHACIQRQDLALRDALDRSLDPAFTAWPELSGAVSELADVEPCRADAVLLEERPRDADPDVIEAVNRGIDRAYVSLMLGDPAAYLAGLEEVERDHADPVRAPVESLWLSAHLGSALNLAGRHGDAAKKLRAALASAHRHPRWRKVEGMLLVHLAEALSTTRSSEATFFAQQAIATLEATPENSAFLGSAWRALAVAQLAAGDAAAALEAVDAARRAKPAALRGHESVAALIHRAATANLRGLALERLGRVDEAEAEYRAGIDAARDSSGVRRIAAQLHGNLGLLLRDAKRYEDARVQLEAGLALEKSLGDLDGAALSLMNLANLELAAGNTARALAHYDDGLATARSEATIVKLHFNRAFALQQDGRHGEAIEGYDRVLASGPNAASLRHRQAALQGRGLARLEVGDRSGAAMDLEDAMARESESADPASRVEVRLALARALRESDRARALAVADEARHVAEAAGLVEQARAVEAWILASAPTR